MKWLGEGKKFRGEAGACGFELGKTGGGVWGRRL